MTTNVAACDQKENENCTAVDEWHFSLGLGAGVITNPLYKGKNTPLVIIPYIHYYGDKIFIENNTLGYSFIQSKSVILSAVSQLNREAIFFNDWQPSHLFIPHFSESINDSSTQPSISVNNIKKRKWAIDGGLQLNWFISDSVDMKAQILRDLNQVYHGYNANVVFNKTIRFPAFKESQFNISIGANWQSKNLANYYYGLGENDNVDISNRYQAGSGIQPFFSLAAIHKFSKKWQLKFLLKQEFLDDNLTHSPLVEENTVISAFIGVVYVF
jgi:MipA family protein